MAAPAPPPTSRAFDSFGRGVAGRLSLELRAMLCEQNVDVSQDIIDALMPRVRACIDEAAADCAREDLGLSPVPQSQPISSLQSPPAADSQRPLVAAGEQQINGQETSPIGSNLPDWFSKLLAPPRAATLLLLPEWRDASYRRSNGWCGTDYVHDPSAPARVATYALLPPTPPALPFPSLIGVAVFTPSCESHKRICHGGAACALFDDAVGWMGFCHTGSVLPWSGFTAQVNASLKRPILAGSVLLLRASVERVDGRKVWVCCELVDPVDDSVHCSGGGLYLKMKDGSGGGGGATAAARENVGT